MDDFVDGLSGEAGVEVRVLGVFVSDGLGFLIVDAVGRGGPEVEDFIGVVW